ncbi:DUF6477 family protein [Paracoccus aerodenitrificans]|uniref:DUF6477 family protein n=1 Tax=Paracoccus aerodenitrificans TaxID=3017781 RepID=UPI0022F12121|nr:DUF6477 family protein [Paracoccus aerodenitrificans]WBU65508.1 DUF6477 family protein [Paracoccus aerodenitrificans]
MSFLVHPSVFRIDPVTRPLRRPRILIRAAKAGLGGWSRGRDLPKLLGYSSVLSRAGALCMLYEREHIVDQARREGRADYDLHQHILLLIAILSELGDAAESGMAESKLPTLSARETARPEHRA